MKLPNTSRAAVFYPLYSFTKAQDIDWLKVPLLLETARKEDEILLHELAQLLTEKIFWISSEQRENLHAAANMPLNVSAVCLRLLMKLAYSRACRRRAMPD